LKLLLFILLGFSGSIASSSTLMDPKDIEDVQATLDFVYQLQFKFYSQALEGPSFSKPRMDKNVKPVLYQVRIQEIDLLKKTVVIEQWDSAGHKILKTEELWDVDFKPEAKENTRVRFKFSQNSEVPVLNYIFWGASKVQKQWILTVDLVTEMAYLESESVELTPSIFNPLITINRSVKVKYSTLLRGPESSNICQLILLKDFRR